MPCILVCRLGLFVCQVLQINTRRTRKWKNCYLCLWLTGGMHEWEGYFGLEKRLLPKLITLAGTKDKWVPADERTCTQGMFKLQLNSVVTLNLKFKYGLKGSNCLSFPAEFECVYGVDVCNIYQKHIKTYLSYHSRG